MFLTELPSDTWGRKRVEENSKLPTAEKLNSKVKRKEELFQLQLFVVTKIWPLRL
jgi:hypothetical protein